EVANSIAATVVKQLKESNLVLLPEATARFSHQFYREREKQLAKRAVTALTTVKYELLTGIKTVRTIKYMVKDGRIPTRYHYKDQRGTLHILTAFLKEQE